MHNQTSIQKTNFSKSSLKLSFWPIFRNELPKFFSMAILMFLILLNQNLIRGIKDSLVVNLIGAQVLSFIKLFVEFPAGLIFVIVYTILCNKMSTENAFRVILLFFLSFFVLFGFVIFPYQEFFHPNPSFVQAYVAYYPHLKWMLMMWSKWALVLFYMMGELWSMVIFTLLYWQLANKITQVGEVRRFYFLFNLFGQSNLLFCGSIMRYFFGKHHIFMPLLGKNKVVSVLQIQSLILVIVVLCMAIVVLHWYIEKNFITKQVGTGLPIQDEKLQLGFWGSMKMILKSRYLGFIVVLMVSYSTVINLIEGVWFYETSLFYNKSPEKFMIYQGKILFGIGVCSFFCSFLGNMVIQKLGWKGTALITPVLTFLVGGGFFLLVVLRYFNVLPHTIADCSMLAIIVVLGGLQNILIKSTKYCFFDVTKEMSYFPLNNEMRTKGKAAVDILGGKLGKSMGAVLQVLLYSMFFNGNPEQLSPLLAILFGFVCIVWIQAVRALAKQYNRLMIGATEMETALK